MSRTLKRRVAGLEASGAVVVVDEVVIEIINNLTGEVVETIRGKMSSKGGGVFG